MAFIMINEDFTCGKCGKEIMKHPEGSARNHCPFCLHSKHVDERFPGDRSSDCHSLMEPIGIDHKKNKGYMIIHKCLKCGKEMLNKIAPDDDFIGFIKAKNSKS